MICGHFHVRATSQSTRGFVAFVILVGDTRTVVRRARGGSRERYVDRSVVQYVHVNVTAMSSELPAATAAFTTRMPCSAAAEGLCLSDRGPP